MLKHFRLHHFVVFALAISLLLVAPSHISVADNSAGVDGAADHPLSLSPAGQLAELALQDAKLDKIDNRLRLAYRTAILEGHLIATARVNKNGLHSDLTSAAKPMASAMVQGIARQVDVRLDGSAAGAHVFVQTTDGAQAMREMGIDVQATIGDVSTAYLPFSRLAEVSVLPSVTFIEAGGYSELHNDAGVPDTGAPAFWNEVNAKGGGALVAIFDSGIDFRHPDFRGVDGSTRIRAMLDFSDPGDRDSDGDLDGPVFGGTAYNSAQIDAATSQPGWFFDSQDTPRNIPDNNSTGTTSKISVPQNVTVVSAAIDLYIQHSWIGDLKVMLTCPTGQNQTIHNRSGNDRLNIIATFDVSACNGKNAQGEWILTISDHDALISGSLKFWNLHVNRPVRMTDQVGHGTHVAGTAAGSGLSGATAMPGGPFIGMAPEAEIIAVRATRTFIGGFPSVDIVNALSWLDQQANALGKPYVVNMSFGSQIGAHDGTALQERAIDNLVGGGKRGKAVVVSAGNAGDEHIHASGQVPAGGTKVLSIDVPAWTVISVDIWYEGSDSFGVGYRRPDGYVRDRTIDPGENGGCYFATDDSYILCLESANNNPNNGDKQITILIWTTTSHDGNWQILLHGDTVNSGRFDAWTPDTKFVNNIDDRMRVGMPGTTRNAITVGAYTTKTQWIDANGSSHTVAGAIGDIAGFSSNGPTHDHRRKPDIAAPGMVICSTLSNQAGPGSNGGIFSSGKVCQGGQHGVLQGTSMSAPHVTGAVALLLGQKPLLDANQIKAALISSARQDSFTGTTPNDTWGYGKLNVPGAAAALNIGPKIYLPIILTDGGG